MSPSERQAADIQRERAYLDRLGGAGIPGPGTYDPRVTEHGKSLGADAATISTFNSSAKKGTVAFNVQSK